MGVDANLYLNTRWELYDIIRLIERTQNTKVKVETPISFDPGFHRFELDGSAIIYVHPYHQSPLGSCTLLVMPDVKRARKIFKDIADVLGGFIEWNDHHEPRVCEIVEGKMCEEDGLPFYLKHAILIDGISSDSLDEFILSAELQKSRARDTDSIDPVQGVNLSRE
ncbi:MAG: hypothetical protein HWN69_09595 [Desulfobacterales bacterium]|nr:hypothetical protein [Desulfobacterales bacterium]